MKEEDLNQKRPSEMNAEEFHEWIESQPQHTELSEDGTYSHVPIAFLEPDLRLTFEGKIEIIIKQVVQFFGAITIHVRLKVFHPVHKIWLSYDGIAATVIESEKPGEWKNTTKTLLLEDMKTGIPACYSVAIQNAAKKIGKRFGSDINRKSTPGKTNGQDQETKKAVKVNNRLLKLIEDAETVEELNKYMEEVSGNKELLKAFNKKLNSLKSSK